MSLACIIHKLFGTMYMLYCKTLLLLLRWDIGMVRDWFCDKVRYSMTLVNSVIIDVITEIVQKRNNYS